MTQLTVQVHFGTGERETCTVDHAIACLSGHIDPWTDEPAIERFRRTGRAQSPYATYKMRAPSVVEAARDGVEVGT
jgi:hypothetical protein